ncbi:G-protein coupled receptor Mth2-like [Venturia canescens]|uniref:G-protein coupled receptor Mth2-like n=1 Tax=Venturia canescens TaxID=32260 RepID=UPI001C9C393C|nr:G-protein coupled receptor Mth2-like [Venturia canescens]
MWLNNIKLALSLITILTSCSGTNNISMNGEELKRPCLKSLAMSISDIDLETIYPNGTLLHEGILYPPKWYWHEENVTYACLCEITSHCIRKCCPSNEILAGSLILECVNNDKSDKGIGEIALLRSELAQDLRNLSRIEDHFVLVKNQYRCPNGKYKLEPEKYDEDRFVLQSNGTLVTGDNIFPQWKYCLDVHENHPGVRVLVCHNPEVPEIVVGRIIYPFGIVISIPFLLATLFVYAVIPELKNLYGMTLMCYVGCLVVAYSLFASANLIYTGNTLCVTIGKSL